MESSVKGIAPNRYVEIVIPHHGKKRYYHRWSNRQYPNWSVYVLFATWNENERVTHLTFATMNRQNVHLAICSVKRFGKTKRQRKKKAKHSNSNEVTTMIHPHRRNSKVLETESKKTGQNSDRNRSYVCRWQEIDIFCHTNQFTAMDGNPEIGLL